MGILKDESYLNGGFIDIHSHILPGLDDGAVALEESVEMAKVAVERGVSEIIATPHSNFSYELNKEALGRVMGEFREALADEGIELEVHPGAEVRASPSIFEKLEDGTMQTLANGKYVLVEMPLDDIPFYMGELVFQLRLKGYTPVLAHPERTAVVHKRIKRLQPLVEQGCLVQLNASSLDRGFGGDFRAASEIMRKGWAFAIGSDAHDLDGRPPGLRNALRTAAKLLGKETALALVRDNPRKILENAA